jgi:hypothetical protein
MPGTAETSGPMMLTAFFDDERAAEKAVSRLEKAGIAKDRIRLVPGYEEDAEEAAARPHAPRMGLTDIFRGFLFPDEDADLYGEALRRGGCLVTVEATAADHDTALEVLDEEGVIDLDERAEAWRADGWTGTPGSAAGRIRRHESSG